MNKALIPIALVKFPANSHAFLANIVHSLKLSPDFQHYSGSRYIVVNHEAAKPSLLASILSTVPSSTKIIILLSPELKLNQLTSLTSILKTNPHSRVVIFSLALPLNQFLQNCEPSMISALFRQLLYSSSLINHHTYTSDTLPLLISGYVPKRLPPLPQKSVEALTNPVFPKIVKDRSAKSAILRPIVIPKTASNFQRLFVAYRSIFRLQTKLFTPILIYVCLASTFFFFTLLALSLPSLFHSTIPLYKKKQTVAQLQKLSAQLQLFHRISDNISSRYFQVAYLNDLIKPLAERNQHHANFTRLVPKLAMFQTSYHQPIKSALSSNYDASFSSEIQAISRELQLEIQALPPYLAALIPKLHPNLSTSLVLSHTNQVLQLLQYIFAQPSSLNVLVLVLNDQELRPTGGYISTVMRLSLDQGKLSLISAQDVYQLDNQINGVIVPPRDLASELGESRWFLRDSNWHPLITQSHNDSAWFLARTLNWQPDLVISLNTQVVSDLIRYSEDIILDTGTVVTPDNLAQLIRESAIAPNQTNQNSILTQLSRQVFTKLTSSELPEENQLWSQLLLHLASSNISLTSLDEKLQALIAQSGYSGQELPSVCQQSSDRCQAIFAYLSSSNTGINFADASLKRRSIHQVTLKSNELYSVAHQYSFTNTSTSVNWPDGGYQSYQRLLIPPEATSINLMIDNKEVSPSIELQQSILQNYLQVSFPLTVSIGQTVDFTVSYEVSRKPNHQPYLWFTPQPGVKPHPFTILLTSQTNSISSYHPDIRQISSKRLNFQSTQSLPFQALVEILE